MHSVIVRYQLLCRGWLPIIPVVMTWRGRSLQSEAYLDSGAFYSIFKMSVATEFGRSALARLAALFGGLRIGNQLKAANYGESTQRD